MYCKVISSKFHYVKTIYKIKYKLKSKPYYVCIIITQLNIHILNLKIKP